MGYYEKICAAWRITTKLWLALLGEVKRESIQKTRREGGMPSTAIRFFLCLLLASILSACEDEPPPVPEQARPIRTFTVTDVASGQIRKFSGVIEASDSSSLSFQISGNVHEVLVNQGDQVTGGTVLAVLEQ